MTIRNKINILRDTYNHIPAAEQARKRVQIAETCGISEKTFYRWLSNPTSVPKLARPIFAKYLKRREAELFPVILKSIK